MRGEIFDTGAVQRAMAVLDLALGGVRQEMADDRFDWFAAPKKAGDAVVVPRKIEPLAPVPLMTTGTPVNADMMMPRASELLRAPEVKAMARPVVVEVAGEVWSEGEAGGVVLVVQGQMPDTRCVALATAMLGAVGVRDTAVAWVGYSGKVEAKALLMEMVGKAPVQVLVLGQGPLGVLLGRNLGVEGWHAAGNAAIAGWDGAPVGVTYPLDLLVKQPLFKRLAWQHLQAWGEAR